MNTRTASIIVLLAALNASALLLTFAAMMRTAALLTNVHAAVFPPMNVATTAATSNRGAVELLALKR